MGKACNEIDELKKQVSKLEGIVDYFRNLWKKFIKFLNDLFFDSNDYDEVINELQYADTLSEENTKIISEKEKN